jgi:poly(glycerol-phosphate) alpha-glucosyltransferase
VIPVVHSVHTAGDVLAGEINNFYRTVFNDVNQPTALVVFTDEQKADIISRMGDCEIAVIPHSGQTVPDGPLPEQRDPKRVVYPARYSVEKHHEQAIEAWKLVMAKVPDAELHFYGFGLDRDKVELMIQEQGVANNVFAHDFEVNVAKVFHSASASILTSGVEAFCLAVMESLFNGCPVVSYDIKYGPSSMIQDGVNGFLVPGNDVNAMAEKLIQILTDRDLRINLSKNCDGSMEKFTHESIGKKWKALLSA